MKALLITGGERPSIELLHTKLDEFSFIVAADGGIEYAYQGGITLDAAVGDMDSLTDPSILEKLGNTKIFPASIDKDFTDTELGVDLLISMGWQNITLWGGGGGRLDHLLAIRTLFERNNPPREWYTKKERIIIIDKELIIESMKDRRVSLFPAGKETCRMRSTGLKWPLDDLIWDNTAFGISNKVISSVCRIEVLSGKLILIHELGDEDRG